MPSPGEDIQSWSVTAADNGTVDPLIDWHEGQSRASVNNSARSEMAAHAKNRNLNNGSIVTTGSPNAQQFLSGLSYTTIPTGLRATLKVGAGLTNTASITLNMDGLGDTLVKTADGNNLLGREFIANGYVDLLYNGTNWIFLYGREFFFDMMTSGGGIIIGKQVFSVAGTYSYVPSAGMECCIIECVGAGGGGGCASSLANLLACGGGGGSGGYSRKYATAADIGASQPVVVGTGGNAAGSPGNGSSGTDTSVGALCIARGGSGGGGSVAGSTIGYGGPGGVPGIGDIVAAGAPGSTGAYNNSTTNTIAPGGGDGGSSALGGGARSTAVVQYGGTAIGTGAGNYGSGGSGSASFGGPAYDWAGNGSNGIVIITEFGGRGTPGRDGATGPIGPPGPSGSGTGDVLRSGTPTTGQIAQWTDTSHIQGVSTSSIIAGIAVPTRTVLTSGSGTFTTPAGATWLEVEMVGGGGGGASGAGATAGSNAGTTTFGTLSCTGGSGSAGSGGIASGGDYNVTGSDGSSNGPAATSSGAGASGAASAFGGAGRGFYNQAGSNAASNSGSGGGGGGCSISAIGGGGGAAGGYLKKILAPPAATYDYSVGAGGNGGAAGGASFAGGNGGSGVIIITTHFVG